MQPTVKMLISGHFMLVFPSHLHHDACGAKKKKAVAQAVTSWNEWLTYKGVSLHVSAQRDAARQKYTREPSATG